MNFLRDNPDESGCCDLRFAHQVGGDGSLLKKTFGLGYFLSLEHLEKWAATSSDASDDFFKIWKNGSRVWCRSQT
jgi:hypothetical protein